MGKASSNPLAMARPGTEPRLPDGLPVGVLEFVTGRGVVAVNQAWIDLTGLGREESSADGWSGALDAAHRHSARRDLEQAARGSVVAAEWRMAGAAGPRWLTVRVAPDPDAGEPSACVAVAVEITADKLRESELVYRSAHDPLTGLLTKPVFASQAAHSLARRERPPGSVAILFIDLDSFKPVNDEFGHGLGDMVLATMGRRLSGSVRPSDALARVGGDEFAVLCEDLADPDDALLVATRVLQAVAEPIDVGARQVVLGASVGVAFCQSGDESVEQLLQQADQAMYRAKQLGRGHCEVFAHPRGRSRVGDSTVVPGSGDQVRGEPWGASYQAAMSHICEAVVLLEARRHPAARAALPGGIQPAVLELEAAVAELKVDRRA